MLGGAPGQHSLATSSGSGGGQSGAGKSAINGAFRPAAVRGSGSWLIAQSSTLTHTGGWAPEYNKDAVTFYRWYDSAGATKKITRVTVWVGVTNRDNKQGQERNTDDPNATVNGAANPVIALGTAWERVRNEIPQVAGRGTSFDPDSLQAVRQVLTFLTTRATSISGTLSTQVKQVNIKSPEFKGSAESAWYHRVLTANHYLSDIQTQNKRWDGALSSMVTASEAFVKALLTATSTWSQITPIGTWQHPYRVIAAMFNGSTLQYGDSGNNPSNAWNLGTQYSDAASKYTFEENGDANEPTVLWTPPGWLGWQPFDAFNLGEWNRLEVHLRQKWVDNLITTFAPVLTEAAKLVTAFTGARNQLTVTAPDPVPPLPMPNQAAGPNGYNPFANIGNPFANIGNPFANIGNPFANIGNPFANVGNPFANVGNPFANVGNPFANVGNPYANTPSGAGANFGLDPFANTPGGGASSFGLNPFANTPGGGASSFGLNPFANAPGSAGFQASSPFTNGGGVGSSPQSLGGLTSDQLRQLDSAGLLDNVPLTPEQADFLRRNGLGVPAGENPMLGQLTPAQLDALRRAGLLDETPLTAAQRANLNLPNAVGGLQQLETWPTSPVDTSKFPTKVDGLDVSPLPPKTGADMVIGDVSLPGAGAHPTIPGLVVGTGGLSSVPGVSGTPGGLSQAGLGLAPGGAGTAGIGKGVGGVPGAVGNTGLPGGSNAAAQMGGGMPFMPGMMGGPGMGGNQDRERQRNTWLKEDERVWGTDPECAPAVIGRRGKPNRGEDDEYPTSGDVRNPTQDERRPYRGR
ncbi:hypothetical protein [Micromonospora rubida]|uniref:hypothetical protein n=1 Tax=Micromonospora rubida TaxID=2697657 RepID=UPI001376ED16|nr:hypothetical protein [Micromonospora rubida]